MKKIYLLLIAIMMTPVGFGQIISQYVVTVLNPGITSVVSAFTDPSVRFTTISTTSSVGINGVAVFGIAAPCTPPTAQASAYYTTSITTSSGTLNWTRGDGTAGVLVVMREAATPAVDPTSGNDTYTASTTFGVGGSTTGIGNFVVYKGIGTSVTVTGLTQNTAYNVAVYEYNTTDTCYNTTELTGTFSTLCTAVYSVPFTEGFEAGVPPTCWTQYSGTNGLGTVQQWQSNATAHSGAAAAYVQWENVTDGQLAEDWLVTPVIDLSSTSNNQLTFYAKDGFSASQGSVYSVRVSTTSQTAVGSFTTVQTYTEEQLGNTYNQKTIDLSAYEGQTVYIAFVMAQDDGDAFFLDTVSVTGSCVSPTNQTSAFNATNINAATGSSTLNWIRGNGDNVLVVAREGSAVDTDPTVGINYLADASFGLGAEIGTGNFVVYNGPAASASVTNLLQNTNYHIAIYEYNNTATCYNLTQLIGNFFVPCAAVGLPFSEGFEGGLTTPSCWTTFRGTNNLGVNQDWQVTTGNANNGLNNAYLMYDSDGALTGTTQDWLVSSPIDLTSVPSSELTFFTKDSGDLTDYGSSYTIRISTMSNSIGDFTTLPIATYNEIQLGSTYNKKTIDLSAYAGETIYIAFVMEQDLSTGGDDWFIDDIAVNEIIATADYIYDNGWIPSNPSGISIPTDNIQIIAGSTNFTAPTEANNLSIDAGAAVIINADASFTASGTIVNNGTLTLTSTSTSYPSLITNSISGSGSLTYERHVNVNASVGGNDLISAPFSGQTFATFASNTTNIVSNSANPTEKLFGPFDKVTGTYLTYDTDVPSEAAVTLDAGTGYRAASTDSGNFQFSGAMNIGNVDVPISIEGPQFAIWNLIGNPYPSYIKLSDFLGLNSSKFNASRSGIYGYNGTSGGFEIWNDAYSLANPNAVITPGQGFLVASNSPSATVNFTPDMRTTGTSDDFIVGRMSNEPVAYLQIKATISSKDYTTDFYFTDLATRGLNPGFDSGVFGNVAEATSLYSRLVEENTGVDMGIQSIPHADLNSDVRIPLGINVPQGQQVTVSMINSLLPDGVAVHLEDTVANTFTLLNNSDYIFMPNSNLNSAGRFFLRFDSNTLSTETSDLDRLQIYALDQTLFVNGLLSAVTTVTLFDIQGRKVLTSDLESGSAANTIDVSKLSTGVYVVKLSNVTQQKTQRVILK